MLDTNISVSDLRNTAINILARREHSRYELKQKLLKKSSCLEDIEVILDDLREHGYQSDTRFTEGYSQMRKRKGFGPVRIQLELQEKRIAEELIAEYIHMNDEQWFTHAKQVRRKRFGENIPDEFEARAKQSRFLQYRGFTHEQIQQA